MTLGPRKFSASLKASKTPFRGVPRKISDLAGVRDKAALAEFIANYPKTALTGRQKSYILAAVAEHGDWLRPRIEKHLGLKDGAIRKIMHYEKQKRNKLAEKTSTSSVVDQFAKAKHPEAERLLTAVIRSPAGQFTNATRAMLVDAFRRLVATHKLTGSLDDIVLADVFDKDAYSRVALAKVDKSLGSNKWFYAFLKRAGLKVRAIQRLFDNLPTDPVFAGIFVDFLNALAVSVLPRNLWNLDQTAFSLNYVCNGKRVIVCVSVKTVYGKNGARKNELHNNRTYVLCIDGAGNALPTQAIEEKTFATAASRFSVVLKVSASAAIPCKLTLPMTKQLADAAPTSAYMIRKGEDRGASGERPERAAPLYEEDGKTAVLSKRALPAPAAGAAGAAGAPGQAAVASAAAAAAAAAAIVEDERAADAAAAESDEHVTEKEMDALEQASREEAEQEAAADRARRIKDATESLNKLTEMLLAGTTTAAAAMPLVIKAITVFLAVDSLYFPCRLSVFAPTAADLRARDDLKTQLAEQALDVLVASAAQLKAESDAGLAKTITGRVEEAQKVELMQVALARVAKAPYERVTRQQAAPASESTATSAPTGFDAPVPSPLVDRMALQTGRTKRSLLAVVYEGSDIVKAEYDKLEAAAVAAEATARAAASAKADAKAARTAKAAAKVGAAAAARVPRGEKEAAAIQAAGTTERARKLAAAKAAAAKAEAEAEAVAAAAAAAAVAPAVAEAVRGPAKRAKVAEAPVVAAAGKATAAEKTAAQSALKTRIGETVYLIVQRAVKRAMLAERDRVVRHQHAGALPGAVVDGRVSRGDFVEQLERAIALAEVKKPSPVPATEVLLTKDFKSFTNTSNFLVYLKLLVTKRSKCTNGKERSNGTVILLVLDHAPAHCTLEVKAFCYENGIDLLFVPKRWTPFCQPLDVNINAQFKRLARYFNDETRKKHEKRPAGVEGTVYDASVRLNSAVMSMNALTPATILKSWHMVASKPLAYFYEKIGRTAPAAGQEESESMGKSTTTWGEVLARIAAETASVRAEASDKDLEGVKKKEKKSSSSTTQ